MKMKKTILLLMSVLMAVVAWAQGSSALDQLKADPYGLSVHVYQPATDQGA